ncbi:circularly permuted type 2 ATP-grasp protein [Aquibium oceanicum]|uniref:Uncharacterized protein n=1 Tax=Aquibium oceanicum TaxID=1670800 RepID=A0A1L3SUI2_9HYPH|nr:circularly permuted type 2 ATP-grasp protein [Aquibium oceanicum]APH73040.1 hypothetical protein BSQ44_17950 [Aquibium oceanicum]
MTAARTSSGPFGAPPGPLAAGYRPVPGIHDEMMDASGEVRPLWRKLVGGLETLGPDALISRFGRADQYLRDAGVYYRVYGDDAEQERAWPLAHVPLLIGEDEWAQISSALAQRAELLEEIVADIYGANRLVAEGLLPPSLIASNPEFLRPLVGVVPASGNYLHFCAFELGRGPDGTWWVLADRTQAPSGAGFALENRVATTRALPEAFASMEVPRLAGFFRAFRDSLFGLVRQENGRVAILTPGIHNETYFEHAYIARYLGMLLLEGEDLTISDGAVMVRTVSGLKPVEVLWRRFDAAFLDPLELNQTSRIGTPGLVDALRGGTAAMVNAPGSGILETRALLAFMPRLCHHLRREELQLPGIATWWCGGEAERRHVADNLDRMMIGPALSTVLPYDDSAATVHGEALGGEARADLRRRLEAEGSRYAGQEAVRLSTAPFFHQGKLEPRPIILRAFACRTPEGWSVMPGGFARIGSSADTAAIAMQRGGRAADVWVVESKPVEPLSLLPQEGEAVRRADPGNLPSRAADNLLWLGRYVERSEFIVRVLRAYHSRLAEAADPETPLLEFVADHADRLGIDVAQAVPPGLLAGIDSTFASAGRIRDRFSPDGWTALKDLSKTVHRFAGAVQPGDDAARAMSVLLRKIAGFSGLVHENMYRFTGWRFLEIGRRLERGIQMSHLLGGMTAPDAPQGALEMLLEVGDSVITHRRRYSVHAGRLTAIDLLALDAYNPRAVLFQLEVLKAEIELLPNAIRHGVRSDLAKEILRLHTEFAIREPQDFTPDLFRLAGHELGELASLIDATYFG